MNAMLLWKTKLKKESLGGQGLRAGPRESGGERERPTVLSSTPDAASLPEILLPRHHSSGAPPTFSVTGEDRAQGPLAARTWQPPLHAVIFCFQGSIGQFLKGTLLSPSLPLRGGSHEPWGMCALTTLQRALQALSAGGMGGAGRLQGVDSLK